MYKFAQSARETALGQEGIPAAQVKQARFRPSVRSVPLALGPSRGPDAATRRGRPPTMAVVAVVGAAALVILVILGLALGGSGGEPGASGSPAPAASAASTPRATARPTPAGTVTPDASAVAPDVAAGNAPVLIEYEVQEGEALVKIAETFGTTRNQILNANAGMRERDPYTEPGMTILVPASAALGTEEIEAQPGFVGYVDPGAAESQATE